MASLPHLITLLSVTAVTFTYASTCSSGWNIHGNRCFLLVNTKRRFSDAEIDCQKKGAHLVSLHSEAENNFVLGLLWNRVPIWIGAYDIAKEGSFWYTDGSRFDYTDWDEPWKLVNQDPSEPMGKFWEDCVQKITVGTWNDTRCGRKLAYVCAKKAQR